MELKKYSKTLFFGATLAVLAGCGGNAATQDQADVSANATGSDIQPVVTSDGAGGDSAVSGQQMTDEERAAQAAREAAEAMPEVNTIYFDFDKSDIRADSRAVLDQHAAYLLAHPSVSVVLSGHADERGTREYNQALGERRGNSVKSYFQLKGVSASQMEVMSYGEERPAVMGHDRAAWAKNRRVEVKY
jgi:peptidoglycan-associated lipoprotein